MASFNKFIGIGNLCRDPQVKYTTGGTAVCEVDIAINSSYMNKTTNQKVEEVTFIQISYFGRIAEVCGEYLVRGSSILVEGRLKLDQWDDKTTGEKRSKLKVVGEHMTMLGKKGDSPAGGNSKPKAEQTSEPSGTGGEYSGGGEFDGGPDEVPF